MTLEIIKLDNDKYLVKFANEELDINKDSENWNIEGINKFLIKLATKTPDGEKIEIKIVNNNIKESNNEEDNVFNHIIELFKEFVNEYNNLNISL